MLEDSVAKHMRADVTVGAFLSGGIDSTAIAALAMRHNPRLITFTTGFEREGFSEVDVAVASAEAIGARACDEGGQSGRVRRGPTRNRLVSRRTCRRPGAGAAVLHRPRGPQARQGGAVRRGRRRAVRRLRDLPRTAVAQAFRLSAPPGSTVAGQGLQPLPDGMRGKSLLHRGIAHPRGALLRQRAQLLRRPAAGGAAGLPSGWTHTDITAPVYATSDGWDPVARMQHIDLFTWLRGDILVKADKMTMANSLELRVPFLDPEVFAVASQLPADQKITRATTKFALRKALEPIVPAHVLNRPKLGFRCPIRHWLRAGELLDWAYAHDRRLTGRRPRRHLPRCATMLDEHRSGTSDHSRRLWTVLIFMLWHAIFVEHSVTPQISEPTYPVQI